ncbi:MAG: hypothetical protein HUU17_04385 [Chthonomonadales bacterium]|nr:hypothetical protein [Chthonomonadales bacterium]
MHDTIALLADAFVEWQTAYGRPDPERCPFVTKHPCISTHYHSPTFLALGLYSAYDATGDLRYRDAADRYATFYIAAMRNPWNGRQRWDYQAFPFEYGMALTAYGAFRQRHPEEACFDGKAAALYEWLGLWRWGHGSYYRNGYGVPDKGIEDCANSDDNCHMGRGLTAYYAISERRDVLIDAEGLALYYLTDVEPGTYKGCWSPTLGTWVVAPTLADQIEHFSGTPSCEMGWGFSSVGVIDFLTALYPRTDREGMQRGIAAKCAASMRWHFDACQFDDGACGMKGRDDRWVGQTAGAILSYLRTRDAGILSDRDVATYRPKAQKGAEWLLAHLTPDVTTTGGYHPVTGQSEPRPPENLAWMLGWTLELLPRIGDI